jgi:FKBP-type peptidyl-prolyl cis-trans isomerase
MLKRLALALAVFAAPAFAASPDAYQVTGTVKDVNADTITVMKGKERFEIARGGDTTAVKAGDKVTVHYKMTETSIEVKTAAKSTAAAPATK